MQWGDSGDNIQDGTIDSSEIQDNTLTQNDLATNSVRAAEIMDGQVRTQEIADNTITETDISDSFVARNSQLLDGIDSANFLRSDVNDNMAGNITFNTSQDRGVSFTQVSNSATPAFRTS